MKTGKELLALIEARLREDGGPEDYFDEGKGPPEAWKEFPMLYLAYARENHDGCVAESGPFGDTSDLMEMIINQAYAVFSVLRDQALKEVGREGDYGVTCWTEPSWEDTAHTVIVDDRYGEVVTHYYCKPWNFCWETPDEMAEEMGCHYRWMVDKLHAAPAMAEGQELLASLRGVLKDAEGYIRTHGAGPIASRNIMVRCDRARAAIAKAEGG